MYLSSHQRSAAGLGGMHAVLGVSAGFHSLKCQRSDTHVQPRRHMHRFAAARPSTGTLNECPERMRGQVQTECAEHNIALSTSQGAAEDASDTSAKDMNGISTLTSSRQLANGSADTVSAVANDANQRRRGPTGLAGARGLLGASISGADGVGRQLTTSQICNAVGRDLSQVASAACYVN